MNFEINSIWTDWRLKVPNGVPNPFNDYHLVLLKELCLSKGIDNDVVDNVILILEKKGETNKKEPPREDVDLLKRLGMEKYPDKMQDVYEGIFPYQVFSINQHLLWVVLFY
jgi:hypothetical protein